MPGIKWKARTRQEIQGFLKVASYFPARPDGQTCIVFGTERLSELLEKWLSGGFEITPDIVEKSAKELKRILDIPFLPMGIVERSQNAEH
ncbi:hypothetical protein LCGC14_0637520 [marine sediment metagenome]|uniref:Uncharacterized protein n=1 Tax=marine sediment metagenome TaxID=412755 RepID=A0A0F9TLK2_9ZZZZ